MASLEQDSAAQANAQANLRRSTVSKSFVSNIVSISTGEVEVIELPTIHLGIDLTGSAVLIWGHPTYGTWGTKTWGKLSDIGSFVVEKIDNPQNVWRTLLTAIENAYWVDTGVTNATINTVNQTVSFTDGQIFQTNTLTTEENNITQATLEPVGASQTGNLTYFLSADGTNFEEVTLAEIHNFTNLGKSMKLKIVSTGVSTISIKNVFGKREPIKISYN